MSFTPLWNDLADEELLSVVSSWRDTLNDEILALLRRYNATGRALRPLR
jgi:hypothetical protein